MRFFYSLCILVYTTATVSAQLAAVEVLTPFDFATNFRDVYVDNSGNGWAVGTCGILASTQNNGQDWAIGMSPEGLDFEVVACKPGTDCQTLLLAKDGQVFRSTNGGQDWTEIPVSCDGPRGFNFVDDQVIVLTHSNESLFRSTDSGDTWTEISLEYTHRGEAHFPTSTTGYIFQQSGGPLLKSTDAGATWDSIYQFEANALYGDWVDENIGFLYDQGSDIFKTTDGGHSWTLVTDTGVPSNLRHLVALSETELVAYVFASNIFRSTDGGVTWVNNTSIIDDGQFGLRFGGIHNNGGDFWISSWGTEILHSTDSLQTATSQFPALRPNFEDIAFPSNEIGYALQERVGMFKTIDGGDTWTQLTNNYYTVSRDFLVLDEETVIIPYNNSGPYITEDGGQTWEALFPEDIQDSTYVFQVEQLPGGRLYLFGSIHGVYSDDGGDSWEVIYHGMNSFPRSMAFIDDQHGVVGSDGGKFIATTDGGESWELVVDGDFTNQPYYNLFVLDDGTIVNVSSGITRCSSDGGQTWSIDACAGLTTPGAIVEGPDSTWYSGRLFPSQNDLLTNIQRSTDEGQTWESIAGFCTYATPGAVTPDGRYLYVYQSAGFLGRVDLETIVGADEVQTSTITQAKVYPNPTTGQLFVDLPQDAGTVQVVLYDLHGRQVQQYTDNNSSLTLDLSALPGGMYLLKVQGDGWLQSARVIVK